MQRVDVLVALGAPSPQESYQRVDTMLQLREEGVGDHAIVTGALSAFARGKKPTETIAAGMQQYAVGKGMSKELVVAAPWGRDTIGDALSAKEVMRANGWQSAALITTESHMPRSMGIFGHVLGSDYSIIPKSAGDFPGRRGQKLYELLGNALCHQVLRGTEPGDDEAIRERLVALVPGYTNAKRSTIGLNMLRSSLGLPLVSAYREIGESRSVL